MDIKIHTTPHKLERYAFIWSLARLVLGAVALFLGGYPLATKLLPIPLTWSLLNICWLISGVASVYLAYRWHKDGQKLFGHKNDGDRIAFFGLVISGLNLGLVPIFSYNIGMSLFGGRMIYFFTGLAYLWIASHLMKKWKIHGEKIF